MKTIASAVAISMILLQGCSSLDMGKFGLGLEQRKDLITNQTSNSVSPMLTYSASFGGEKQKTNSKDEMAMKLDESSSKDTAEFAVILGVIALALATKKTETAAKKPLVCSTTNIPYQPPITSCF